MTTTDTRAINTIAQVLSDADDWENSADLLDEIAAVLNAVRTKVGSGVWEYGDTLTWDKGCYV